jgi:hypothetical protein
MRGNQYVKTSCAHMLTEVVECKEDESRVSQLEERFSFLLVRDILTHK